MTFEMNWEDFAGESKVRLNIYRPITTPGKSPNKEGLKLLWEIQGGSYIRQYPKKCKTDELKFEHLAQLFLKRDIERDMFLDFADVLVFLRGDETRDKKIVKVLKRAEAMEEPKWVF